MQLMPQPRRSGRRSFLSEGTFGTCGSGIYEAVLQVQNISTQADLNEIAQAELTKSGGIPFILNCYTNKPGLFVGQQVDALFPKMGLGSSPFPLLITAITRTANSGVPLSSARSSRQRLRRFQTSTPVTGSLTSPTSWRWATTRSRFCSTKRRHSC